MTRDRRGRPRPCPTRACRSSSTGSATNLCPGLPPSAAASGRAAPPGTDRRVLIFTEYTDTKRYLEQQLQAAIAGTDRAADRIAHLPRRHGRRHARGDQARLQRRPGEAPAAHPDRHRRRARGRQPPEPLRRPLPLRRAVEPQPHGAAQRPHRPQAPARARGALPLLLPRAAAGGPRAAGARAARPRRSRRSWAA